MDNCTTGNYGLLFYFLRKGLWKTEEVFPDESLPTQEEWEQLFALAYAQAVTGIVTDGIAQTELRPERERWEQWIFHLFGMEQMNREAEHSGEKWLRRLEEAGIQAFIMKGTSVARWYPEPLHRSWGDVDIVVKKGWEKLEPFLKANGLAYRNENGDLVLEEGERIPVEFHRQWEYTYNPMANARLQRLTRQADEQDREVYLVCLILHLRRHFLTYGIGLKQVCDVAVMLHAKEIDQRKVARLLKRLQATRFSRLLFGFIAQYIGGTASFPLPPIRQGKEAALFCNIILNEGYRLKMEQEAKAQQSRSAIGRIAENTRFWLRRGWMLLGIMPGEALCFLGYMAGRRIRKII